MNGKKNRKKKKRSESDDELNNSVHKRIDLKDSPESASIISEVLGEANSVLFEESYSVTVKNLFEQLGKEEETVSVEQHPNSGGVKMATGSEGPTNSDIVAILGQMNLKLSDMGEKLKKLDVLEEKVKGVDKELKQLWVHVDKMTKECSERITRVEDRVDSADIDIEGAKRRIGDLERSNEKLKDDMNYLRSQSMRNNLIFGNIPEEANETPAKSEKIVRDFMVQKLKIAQATVDEMKLERVHRMGQKVEQPNAGGSGRGAEGVEVAGALRHRNIVCKFTFFSDRETVRGQSKELKGTKFYVSEQFPPDIAAKRRRLFQKAKVERQAGRRAWVSYDTLYVDGRPVTNA